MEQKNDTTVFGQKDSKANNKNNAAKMAGAAMGGAAIGVAATAFAANSQEDSPKTSSTQTTEPTQDPKQDPATEPTQEPTQAQDTSHTPNPHPNQTTTVEPEPSPSPTPSPDPEPAPEPTPSPEPNIEPEPDPDIEPEPEPVMPIEEIDPNDIDLGDVVEDVTNVEVVYDVNGNEMLVATAHNSTDGEFYLVDADMDGDFDIVLDGTGTPVVDLTGENDRLITVTDIEQKITDEYIPPTVIDEQIAKNDMIGEDIQNDITIIDDSDIA